VDPIAKGLASDVGESHQGDDGTGEAVEMAADGGVVEGGGHGGGWDGMECRDGLPAGRGSAELPTKFDQFHNFDLEHGFAAVVSAKHAGLSF